MHMGTVMLIPEAWQALGHPKVVNLQSKPAAWSTQSPDAEPGEPGSASQPESCRMLFLLLIPHPLYRYRQEAGV